MQFNLISSLFNLVKGIGVINNRSKDVIPEEEKEVIEPIPDPLLDILTPTVIKKELFSFTPIQNIEENWPLVYQALKAYNLHDTEMVCYVLATIVVETDKFKPIAEQPSKWSTKTGKPPYDFSNYLGKLGNTNLEMASLYRGSGFLQLTGYDNYKYMDAKLNLDGGLIKDGYIAGNEPHIASYILAQFIKDREPKIRNALSKRDFKLARTYVNGKAALHYQKLQEAYEKLEKLLS